MSKKHPLCEGRMFTDTLFSEPVRVRTMRFNSPPNSVTGLVRTHSERFRTGCDRMMTS